LFTKYFGGLDIILIGDLRQLKTMSGETPWQKFKKIELHQVMRQEDSQFVEILTKIDNGNILTKEELQVIKSRFITKEEARRVCSEGIRLIFTNNVVNKYNHSILNSEERKKKLYVLETKRQK
jgi:hypothetical protein